MVGVAFAVLPVVAVGAPVRGRSDTVLVRAPAVVRAPAGASVIRLKVSEPAGVIRLFRVVATAGTEVRVTSEIPGLAGVSIAMPSTRHDNAETCARHSRAIACTQGEEACPMPSATWQIRVRKMAGPAGRIRIDFVVGPDRSARVR